MIKLFGWERKMENKISDKRGKEIRWVLRGKVIEMIIDNLKYVTSIYFADQSVLIRRLSSFLIPFITMIATFGTYVRLTLHCDAIYDLITAFLDLHHEGKPYCLHCVFCNYRYAQRLIDLVAFTYAVASPRHPTRANASHTWNYTNCY